MSGLQEFLAPFSHLLFANRNIVIVLVCAAAFWAAIQALKDRWRADRLERDLSNARSSPSSTAAGRRYANATDDASEAGGALPPVKGGRSYARNLGSALQKAGMSGPQIYSPPTPAGFAPQSNPMQPALGQPATSAPYAPTPAPWGSSPPQPPAPWGFPGPGGRNAPPPAQVPFYQPQLPQPPAPVPMPAPPAPNVPTQPVFSAPSSPPAFAPPQAGPFAPPTPTSAPAGPAPSFTPPPVPGPMVSPPTPPVAPASQDVDASDGGRRGKPKRRRFNFNVLENLEKMVQPKPAEPAGSAQPAAPPFAGPPATSSPPVPSASTPAPPPVSASPAPSAPKVEAPSLPFLFGQRSESKPPTPAVAPEEAASPAVEEQDEDQKERQSDSAFERYEPPATPEPEVTAPEAVATPTSAEPGRPQEARRSMRSMMFGEEIAPASAPKSEEPERKEASEADAMAAKAEESETGSAETGSAEGEPTWSSEPWLHREEASSSESDVSGATDETASEETTQPLTSESEPALKPFGSYDPWKPAESTETELAPSDTGGWKSEREPEAEPVAEVGAEAEPASAEHAAAPVNGGEAELMAESADGSAGDTQLGDGDRGTLVIIEDDQTAASYYATLFKGNGYHVEVANDGVSGVDLCTRVQPQVILLDVMMPRQNGILVLQTLRASDETKNTPVVVMSNFSEPTLIKRALQLGALEYVIKTQVEGPALLSALPRWMNREKAFAAA